MLNSKCQNLETREKALRDNQTACACCGERPAKLYWRKLPVCAKCLNPDIDKNLDYQRRLYNYWCEPKSSIQAVTDQGGWGEV